MPATFEPNHAGLREYMLSADLAEALMPKTEPILARAKALAAQHERTGDYERSIHIERNRSTDRVRAQVVADDPKAEILEARYHFLGKAITG